MATAETAPRNTRPAAELGRFVHVERATRTFGAAAVTPLLDAALTGDDLALEVVEDFSAMRGRGGRDMLKLALDDGIDAVPGAPASLRRLFAVLDDPPEWVDDDQLRRGATAYLRGGPLAGVVLTSAATAANERAYGVTRPLVFTGRMSGSLAAIRAREVTRWMAAAVRPGGMQRHQPGFTLTVQVRMLHAMTRRGLSESPDWQWDEWGMPLADLDGLFAISFDFTQAVLDALIALGVRFSVRELDDIYALWRYIGHVIGVPGHLLPISAPHGRELAGLYLELDRGADAACRDSYHARMRLASGVDGETLDVLPRALARHLAPARRLKLLYGCTRYWTGDELADTLSVPDTRWKHLPRLVRPGMRLIELGRALRLIDDERLAGATLRQLERASTPASAGDQRRPLRSLGDQLPRGDQP